MNGNGERKGSVDSLQQPKKSERCLLRCEKVSHSFDYPLFNDVSLSLKEGESLAVLGVSGSGKSTLLHILSTLLKPQKGEVEIDNQKIYELNQDELLNIRRQFIGIIFQAHYLFNGFSGYENIEIASIMVNKTVDKKLLKFLKIDRVINQKVTSLSGGQQQRVSIARVLMKKPKLIFADEPTGNLDTQTANDVMESIFSYIKSQKAALFLVTHDENMAKKCDRVYRLKEGEFKEISNRNTV